MTARAHLQNLLQDALQRRQLNVHLTYAIVVLLLQQPGKAKQAANATCHRDE